MKKKRRSKNKFKLFLVIILIVLCFINRNKLLSVFDNRIKNNDLESETTRLSFDIVDSEETDKDIVKEVFAEGMSVNDFKKILNQNDNYINSTHEYKEIEYNFEEKLHYSELEEYYNMLNNSDIVKLENIGKSVDNRILYGIEIGKGSKVVFIDSNIHAAEVANTYMILKYMITIVNNYEKNDEDIINMLNEYTLVVMPCINPDGYEVYNFGVDSLNNKNLWLYKNRDDVDFSNLKSNANGVDINRNFPTQNAGLYYTEYDLIKSVSLDKTTRNDTYYGGTSLGSEPETKAIMYLMIKHYQKTIYYMNMHSQGRVIYQGKPNLSDSFNSLCKDFASKVSKYTSYRVHELSSEEVGEGNDGSATDFMAELANGLKFSSVTGKLTMNRYKNDNTSLKYKYPVITIETIDRYTRDTKYFYDEYYYKNYYDMFTSMFN